jgi:hypothetical protein
MGKDDELLGFRELQLDDIQYRHAVVIGPLSIFR